MICCVTGALHRMCCARRWREAIARLPMPGLLRHFVPRNDGVLTVNEATLDEVASLCQWRLLRVFKVQVERLLLVRMSCWYILPDDFKFHIIPPDFAFALQ